MSNDEDKLTIKRRSDLTSTKEKKEDKISSVLSLRPTSFKEYPGQQRTKENLGTYVQSALKRNKQLDHIILHGPPGLGKTTLAHIIAHELNAPFYNTSGPSIAKPGDLAGILAGMEKGALFFIDEIHRLSIHVEEILYTAMEDFAIDLVVGQGASARTVQVPLQPFTLVGATTRLSSLSRPFLSRFGIQERLEYYDTTSLLSIIKRSALILSIELSDNGALALAQKARGTPRVVNRLLKRVWDFASMQNKTSIDEDIVNYSLKRLDIDQWGLDQIDRQILTTINTQYNGGPVGIETIAVTLGEEKATLEEVYEPYLIFSGYLTRGPRGRSIKKKGKSLLEHTMN